ncbi:alpha/beta hydrolase [Lyngbya sp. CCY1209]|uniref:alpha/beta hydrolase n=1 Tax=Lyngbya sp. CCY1209 TaxID=2886103 RepID=UPI002D1FC55E|nr:alpha/beta hydrolase [Lyngbya sp. CCY1209]MEB3883488.1 alpha/beta hydrolase [Lyngbya sp. CCY1209]
MERSPNAETQAFLNLIAESDRPPLHTLTPAELRSLNQMFLNSSHPPEPLEKVENRTIPGPGGELPIRIYTPAGNPPFPVLVYFHGGGYVLGDLDMVDSICRTLANGAKCIVVSVDYRLAPEHPFPAAIADGFTATEWVFNQAETFGGDRDRVAVGGESAGGNLVAVVALMRRDRSLPPLVYQLLIYPSTQVDIETESRQKFADNYFLTADSIAYFCRLYLPDITKRRDPLASPLLTKELSNLPPALIITAEFDPLRDEGQAYGDRLKKAGVPVQISCYPGTIHAFVNLAGILSQGREALAESAIALKRAFYSEN